jgi:hypothetical protein
MSWLRLWIWTMERKTVKELRWILGEVQHPFPTATVMRRVLNVEDELDAPTLLCNRQCKWKWENNTFTPPSLTARPFACFQLHPEGHWIAQKRKNCPNCQKRKKKQMADRQANLTIDDLSIVQGSNYRRRGRRFPVLPRTESRTLIDRHAFLTRTTQSAISFCPIFLLVLGEKEIVLIPLPPTMVGASYWLTRVINLRPHAACLAVLAKDRTRWAW